MKLFLFLSFVLNHFLSIFAAAAETFPDKTEIFRLEAQPGFDSVTLSWIKFHESMLPDQTAVKGN